MALKIKRITILKEGCFGVMMDNRVPFAVTLERTFEPTEHDTPLKIPAGKYRCTKTMYEKGGYATFEIHVVGHSRILFHTANVESELEGCIAIGEQFGVLKGVPAILMSGDGFKEFMSKVSNLAYFDIDIEECLT